MSYYVKRQNRETGRISFVGPIRSATQAGRESDAWVQAGQRTRVLESSSEVRAEVRLWMKDKDHFQLSASL